MNTTDEISCLTPLVKRLTALQTPEEKYKLITHQPDVSRYLYSHPEVFRLIETFPLEERVGLAALIVLGQEDAVFSQKDLNLKPLAATLCITEFFFKTIGGVVGYHQTALNKKT